MDQPTALQLDLPAVQLAQKLCKQGYKQQKREDTKLRQEFQLRVKERGAIKFGTLVETQEKITKSAFKTKNTFSRIRKVIQKNPRAAITYVEETDTFDITVECFERSKIEEACITEGKKRYSQSHSFPFLNTPLLKDFGYLGNQDNVNAILAGTYDCPQKTSTHSPNKLSLNCNDHPS
jgi:hypothetical protein